MSNLNRNDKCHCGSGKKYKKCCMESDNAVPTNTFRDDLDVLKTSPAERLRNDQRILMLQLQHVRDRNRVDREHLHDAAESMDRLAHDLFTEPDSTARDAALTSAKEQAKKFREVADTVYLSDRDTVILATLEAANNERIGAKGSPKIIPFPSKEEMESGLPIESSPPSTTAPDADPPDLDDEKPILIN